MNILITGVSGFIGSRLKDRLLSQGHQVKGAGRSDNKVIHQNYSYIKLNNYSVDECLDLLKDIDAVVHCAGKAGVWGDEELYYQANVTITKNLLIACKESGVQRFINLSTPTIYFQYKDQFNLSEDMIAPQMVNAYANTKLISEKVVNDFHSENLFTLSLRPRGVIGLGDTNWLPRIIELQESNSLIQPGNGENLVDFTSIDNLLDVISYCLFNASRESFGSVYNISNGSPEKLWDVVDHLLKGMNLDPKRKKLPRFFALWLSKLSAFIHQYILKTIEEPRVLPLKVGVASFSMTLNIDKAKRDLNYNPKVDTYQAIDEFINGFKK